MGNRNISTKGQKLNSWRKDLGPKPPKQEIPGKARRKQKHGGKHG